MNWRETQRRTCKDILVTVYVGPKGWTIHKLKAREKNGARVWSYTVKRDDKIKAVGLHSLDEAMEWAKAHRAEVEGKA